MIDVTVDADGIATLTWNVPDRPVNVLNRETQTAFLDAVQKVAADPSVKGAIIASAKGDFIAGADLDKFLEDQEAQALFDQFTLMDKTTRCMETSGKPFVAAINGHALGGGFEIALGCHARIASDNPKTQVGLPEVSLGLLPGGGGTQRIPRMIGLEKGLRMLTEGTRFSVTEAAKIGIVDAVVPADDLLSAAKKWCLDNPDATQPWDRKGFTVPGGGVQTPRGQNLFMSAIAMTRAKTYGNYPALPAILSCVYEGLQVDIDTGLRLESRYLVDLVRDRRTRAMIRTTFFGMGDAKKLKSRPKDVPKADYSKIGILGAGMMGGGIAYVSAMAGLDVVLLDVDMAAAEKGKAYSEKLLKRRVERGRMTEADAEAVLGRVTPTTDFAALAGCELVIEAVVENRQVKADVTRKAEAVIGAEAIFASNTSTLPITGLAEASERPDNFIGLHFFSPVDRMPLVEIIKGEQTGTACVARAMDYVARIRMTPIVVNDSRGFFTSRVFKTYVLEGMALLREGVAPALIENAGKIAGMPVGPLEVTDATSLSLLHDILKQTKHDLGDAYEPHPGEAVLDMLVEQLGRPGRKAGKGFYEYPADGEKRLWPGLSEAFPPAAEQPDVEEVRKRLMHIQCIEALRCMEEGVIDDAMQADIGSILGWGFPVYTGGVISYADVIGADIVAADCARFAQEVGPRYAPPASLMRQRAA